MAVKMNGITDNHTDRMNPTKILNVKKKQSKTKTGRAMTAFNGRQQNFTIGKADGSVG